MFESVEENQFPSHNQEMQRDPSIAEALDHFSQAVSMGVSVLCDRLGYSSTRAADSILNTFTESKYTLDDDKVFAVMRRYGVSFDDAAKMVTTADCFRITMSKFNLSPMDAIRHLTSKLNVDNLLKNTIEKAKFLEQETMQPSQLTDFVQSLPSFKTPEVQFTTHNFNNRQPALKSIKAKASPRIDLPPKVYGNEIKQDGLVAHPPEDLDAKLAEKALSEQVSTTVDPNSQKIKAPTPLVTSVRSKRLCIRDGTDNQNQQPPLKRPRTESV